MKTRDIIEHLLKYEELIDSVDFLGIDVSNVGARYIAIHCSSFEQNTLNLFKDNASEVVITKHGNNMKMSLNFEGVEYFMLVNSEEKANYILKGEWLFCVLTNVLYVEKRWR